MRHQARISYVSGHGWFFAEDLVTQNTIFIRQKNVEHRRFLKVDDIVSAEIAPSVNVPDEFQGVDVKYIAHRIAAQFGEKSVQS